MFLDPDPKQQGTKMSGFIPSPQSPTLPARDANILQRKPLHERSKSQHNQLNRSRSPQKPTVRLVRPSPTPSSPASRDSRHLKENWSPGRENFLRLRGDFEASADDPKPLREIKPLSFVPISKPVVRDPKPRPSGSTMEFSDVSTVDDSGVGLTQLSDWSEQTTGSTLFTIPTLQEQEAKPVEDTASAQNSPTYDLPLLHAERGRARPTVRAVTPSLPSDDSISRPQTAQSHESDNDDVAPGIPRKSSKRSSSVPSTKPLSVVLENRRALQTSIVQRRQRTDVSPSYAESSSDEPSSPNFVSYSPESSQSQPLHHTASIDSIGSRLQSSANKRPETGRSLAESNSSLQSSSDVLPPLRVPKKRAHHKAASASLSSQASSSSQAVRGSSSDDRDANANARTRYFSNNLSTIVSESEQMTQMSVGSTAWNEVETGNFQRPNTRWPAARQESEYLVSITSSLPSPTSNRDGSMDIEPGDMTLGIYREQSAIPQPLFRTSPPVILEHRNRSPVRTQRAPHVLGSPENDEHFDTLTDLQAPPHLRQKRSGYSIRQRSNSTPSRSHSRQNSQVSSAETDRWSYGSSIFPVWAKHYYSGSIQLKTKLSSSSLSTQRMRPAMHTHNDSTWTDVTPSSRLGTSDSNRDAMSYVSSPFLPSILRSRLVQQAALEESHMERFSSSTTQLTAPSEHLENRPDSMIIEEIGSPETQHEDGIDDEVLPSGQPKWGTLKEEDDPGTDRRPIPRMYNTQRQWDTMEFPRPMTKDRMSDFGMHQPYLARSKRDSFNRLSAWRPPSFTDGLDTLVRSRCNRQILLFSLGFICPPLWILAAILPLPQRTSAIGNEEKGKAAVTGEEDLRMTMMQHSQGHAELRWSEERTYLKAKWWRILNRIMSVIGLLVIGAIVALAVVATR